MSATKRVEHTLWRERRRQRRVLAAVAGFCLAALAAAGAAFFVDRVEIAVAPPDAAAHAAIAIAEGHGVVLGAEIWALKGPLTVRVGAPGFVSESLAIAPATRERGRADAILRERPARLQATTDPPLERTTWLVDGAPAGQGAGLDIEVASGVRTVAALHPHHEAASRIVTAERAGNHALVLALARVRGTISITSEPAGALVTLDGAAAGTTPLDIEAAGGVHEVRLSLGGYRARGDTIEISMGARHAARHYRLVRARAQVSFSLSPEGGVFTIDGRAVPPGAVDLAAGTPHRARYDLEGHAGREIEFTLAPGEERAIALALEPVLGIVEIRSEPEADVEVGGAAAGRTPLRLALPAVEQTVRLSRPGYGDVTRTVTPVPDIVRTVAVALVPEAQLQLAAAAQYTNSAGTVLMLFRDPGTVVLGTRRGERGRRANEFVREVRLARAFYAAAHHVTVAQFHEFSRPGAPSPGDRRPVTGIGWEDAARYCNWLSGKEGLAPVYRFAGGVHTASDAGADGYRLPTEAEWEWLARKAGRARQTRFPWGDDAVVPARAGNLADESARGKVPVYIPRYNDGFAELAEIGKFPANAAGLHDLAGNAREWTHDSYDPRPPPENRVETDPLDTRPAARHVVKGSSWRSGTLSELRAAYREGTAAPRDDIGFRVARYVAERP